MSEKEREGGREGGREEGREGEVLDVLRPRHLPQLLTYIKIARERERDVLDVHLGQRHEAKHLTGSCGAGLDCGSHIVVIGIHALCICV